MPSTAPSPAPSPAPAREWVAILDFGSQYSQLIARRVREQKVYCELVPYNVDPAALLARGPRAIILSGGPASVYEAGSPRIAPELLRAGVPVLGICYGMQLAALLLGGEVAAARAREYGGTRCHILDDADLLFALPADITVWMSHGDQVARLSDDFLPLARTENCPLAAVRHRTLPFYGVQFHPEVAHTPRGRQVLHNFLFRIAGCRGDWRMDSYVESAVAEIRATVADRRVVCALSGGVDSAVVATLVHRAIGDRLTCVFVDNGLLRKDEARQVLRTFRERGGLNLRGVDAAARFLERLRGVTDPEEKRMRIGHEFVEVFKEEVREIPDIAFLAQGTLYPDVIESQSAVGGPSARIKTHHNVGGLPENLPFKLIEPLRFLFKDEVREIGRELGLPDEILLRQPFPGPGLAVRVVGPVTPERLAILREADEVVTAEVEKAGVSGSLWQYFAVLLPVQSVGVMGDGRTYESVVAVRAVESTDGMTADWARLPYDLLAGISTRIVGEVKGVNRVVYDLSSKPPGTIEWE
ncbi:MAG: glutamine-hydrolyzing GMP synthase [Planctomycetes bacterium]|nr:glutamine-hydrolyzing GMP synthase [Planctomycetota bacterium]